MNNSLVPTPPMGSSAAFSLINASNIAFFPETKH